MEAKIRKELEGIEDVKNELRRTLSQGLGDLENVYFEEHAYLETLYNHEQPEVDMLFKSISDAEMSLDRGGLLKSLKQEKTKMHSRTEHADLQTGLFFVCSTVFLSLIHI